MRLTFLSADVPLTKTFSREGPTLTTEPYPNVYSFTSHEEHVNSIQEFATALTLHATQGHCLLKGNIKTPLVSASRAGSTDRTEPTNYIVFDLDFLTTNTSPPPFKDPADFLATLQITDTSYVWQHSASAGIKYPAGLRGHLFLQLTQPVLPAILKLWLQHLNLTTPALRSQISLTATGMSLHWPLDITVCQNDKLIYIAPPLYLDATTQEPLPDPLADTGGRIFMAQNSHETWEFPALPPGLTAEHIEQQKATLIAELRAAAGLPKIKPRFKTINKLDVLANPSRATITGAKQARGYTYLNLNGGDSWGYYFPDTDPEVLYNFKDEEPVLLRQLDPDFYASLQKSFKQPVNPIQNPPNLTYQVLRDVRTDTRYTVIYNTETNEVQAHPVSRKEDINDFCKIHGLDHTAPIDTGTVIFDPTTDQVYRPEERWVNTFRPTPYMTPSGPAPQDIPLIINVILGNIFDQDQEMMDHFINWLACAFKTRRKLGTAWLLQGVQGTGKGLFFDRVITPLFGPSACFKIATQHLSDKFNGFRKNALMLFLDEINIPHNEHKQDTLLASIKNLVTEENTTLRAMRQESAAYTTYDNVIMATNQINALPVEEGDRRFHLPNPGTQRLDITDEELDQLPGELRSFANYLHEYPHDVARSRIIFPTKTRRFAMAQAGNSIDATFRALRNGDISFFADELKPRSEAVVAGPDYQAYDAIVRRMIANAGEYDFAVSRQEIQILVDYLRGETTRRGAFTKMLQHKGIDIIQFRDNDSGERLRGIKVDLQPYTGEETDQPLHLPDASSNVIQLNARSQYVQ